MPIFRDTVALEACPAKTAESIAYGATFAVLGWLLISNYSGLGNAEPDPQPIANVDSPSTEAPSPTTFANTEAVNETPFIATALAKPIMEVESSNFDLAPPAWHAEMEQFPQFESHSQLRALSTAIWSKQANDSAQKLESLIEDLNLPLPLIATDIDTNDLFGTESSSEASFTHNLTDTALAENDLVREITVTGTEAQRLSKRPDNIQRPQIPRPYRAREIQRSLILPPRIQALKP